MTVRSFLFFQAPLIAILGFVFSVSPAFAAVSTVLDSDSFVDPVTKDVTVSYSFISDQKVVLDEISVDGDFLVEDSSLRTDSSRTYISDSGLHVTRFYASPIQTKIGSDWFVVDTAKASPEAFDAVLLEATSERPQFDSLLNFFFIPSVYAQTTDTFYAGHFGQATHYNGSWTTSRTDASSANWFYDSSNEEIECATRYNTAYIIRCFVGFDTSTIGAGNTVTAASLFMKIDQTSAPAELVLTTFDADGAGSPSSSWYGAVDLEPVEVADRLSTDPGYSYHEFVLNQDGMDWVNTEADTFFALREGNDVDNGTDTSSNFRWN